jgi:hypothetical protein
LFTNSKHLFCIVIPGLIFHEERIKKSRKEVTAVPEKEPKKKIASKPAAKKMTEKKGLSKETKKAAVPKKRALKEAKAEKPVKEELMPVDHKVAESPEESKIGAAKYYPAQMPQKNGKKHEAHQPPAERVETEIPGRYHDNKIVLMARDPYWCYAYWDISAKLMLDRSDEAGKSGEYRLVLRVYDVTDIIFNGKNAHRFMDIEVTGDANNWYINVWEAGRTYVSELGFRTKDGKFIVIARSNSVGMPSDKVSDKTDEEWMVVDEDFEELLRMSGGGKPGGGSEGFRSLIESGLSSGSVSSFSSPVYLPGEKKGFFLWADTEIILYGATEKNAKLTVKGEVVGLKSDGSFSLRFHLPDGVMELPIEAVSADGSEKKSLKINVQRKTE